MELMVEEYACNGNKNKDVYKQSERRKERYTCIVVLDMKKNTPIIKNTVLVKVYLRYFSFLCY